MATPSPQLQPSRSSSGAVLCSFISVGVPRLSGLKLRLLPCETALQASDLTLHLSRRQPRRQHQPDLEYPPLLDFDTGVDLTICALAEAVVEEKGFRGEIHGM